MNLSLTKAQVFLIDDQVSILKALSRLFGSEGFETKSFDSAEAFLKSLNEEMLGCVVLDLAMPGMDGMALQRALTLRGCVMPIIFMTGHGDIATGVQAMKCGAFDFLTKPVDGAKLVAAVHAAFEKNLQLRQELAERQEILARVASLTPREREVLALVVEGKMNKQVAAELGIVEKTIKVHRARVMAKMQVRSLAALVRLVDQIDTLYMRGSGLATANKK